MFLQVLRNGPKGDKLVSPFVYQDDKLVGFVDTKALTTDSQTTIYLPYEHIEADFSAIDKGQLQIHAPKATTKTAKWSDGSKETISEVTFKYKGCTTLDDIKAVDANYQTTDIINGTWSEPLWDLEQGWDGTTNGGMFYKCSNLTSFNSDLSNLTNSYKMFYDCDNLTSFSSDLPSLTSGNMMFAFCDNLSIFTSDLSNLTKGEWMFFGCANLTAFNSDLSSLISGIQMFYDCTNLTSFNSDLSSLTNGTNMFIRCTNLASFNSDLSSLTEGSGMFQSCFKLTSFNSDLSSLTDGEYMFHACKLDTASVQNIAVTINTYSGTIHIGIGNSSPNEQETTAFNNMVSKGWTVYVNGSEYTPTSPAAITTLDENGEETVTPIPYYAKPVPATEETATYTDEQGNYYNIVGAQFIYGDDLSTYGMFTCEADAAANMRLTSYTKPIEN